MRPWTIFFAVVSALTGVLGSGAPPGAVLNYEGRIAVAGKPYNGQGFFAFSILDSQGVILWASGEFPFQGKTNLPAGVMKLPVQNGAYQVRLGATTPGLPVLDGNALRRASDPRLRIWFHDGTRGWFPAGNDVPLNRALGMPAESSPNALSAGANESILRELRDLRARLERQQPSPHVHPPAPEVVTVSVADAAAIGQAGAPVVMVEFTDYQCGYCKQFNDGAKKDLLKNYVETGRLRLVTRNLTLPFHTNAEPAALAALCAHQQQKFWPMRDKLFANISALTSENFLKSAEDLGLDMSAFRACLEAKTFSPQIKKDGQDAAAAGITATPTFVLGRASGDKVTGLKIVGSQSFAAFEAEIKKVLAAGD